MNQVIRFLGALCLGGAALVGCANSEPGAATNDVESASSATADTVKLRFVHGSPTSPALDIYLGASTTPTWTSVAFSSATPYLRVPVAGLQLVLRTAGAAATDAPLYTSDVIVAQPGTQVTSIAGGLLGSTAATTAFRVQAYTEAFARAERGDAVVRFIQESFGLAATGFDIGADGTVEVPGVPAFTASDAAGVAVAPSFRRVQVGITDATATQLTAFTLPRDVLAQRGGIFLALVGVPSFVPHDPRGLALLAIGPETTTLIRQNPTLYVLPAIPDSTGIDVLAFGLGLRGDRIATNLGFGVLSPAAQVAPSEFGYGLIVTKAATETSSFGWPLAFESTGPLIAGERYLAVASGFETPTCTDVQCDTGRSRVRVTVLKDGFDRTVAATGRMRAVAAAADAPAVDFGQFAPGSAALFNVTPGLTDIAYPDASAEAGASVTASPLNPGVRVTGMTDTLRFKFAALLGTDRIFGIVAGAFAPVTGDIQSRFIVVKTPASGTWTAQTLSPQL